MRYYKSNLMVKYPDGKFLLNFNDVRVELEDHLNKDIKPLIGAKI